MRFQVSHAPKTGPGEFEFVDADCEADAMLASPLWQRYRNEGGLLYVMRLPVHPLEQKPPRSGFWSGFWLGLIWGAITFYLPELIAYLSR